jgi:hypothetical protein
MKDTKGRAIVGSACLLSNEAQQLISKVDHLKVVSLSTLDKGMKYQIRVKAKISKDTQPAYLYHPPYSTSKWNFETQWYTIDFVY